MRRGSSDGLQTGRPAFDFRKAKVISIYSAVLKLNLGPTQPPIQWVPGAYFPGAKDVGA
jgi:hypothetical protein